MGRKRSYRTANYAPVDRRIELPKNGANEKYPDKVVVDFSALRPRALERYVEYHSDIMAVRGDASHHEKATAVAQHFETFLDIDRAEDTINAFVNLCRQGGHARRKRKKTSGTKRSAAASGSSAGASASNGSGRRRILPIVISTLEPGALARGQKVAAKNGSGEDATWILGSIVKYSAATQEYEIEDDDSGDDESSNSFRVPYRHAAPLHQVEDEDNIKSKVIGWHFLREQTRVLAMYPHTTSFYAATVLESRRDDCVVQFDDDEDESGTIPMLPIPNRYILECH